LQLRKSYGNVYSLFLGRKPIVVINGVKAMKEAMVSKAAEFAGRPQDMLINDVTQRKGLFSVDYGASWKEHRRFSLMTMRNFGLGKKSMEERIHGEIQYTMKMLDKNIGKTLTPQVMFHNVASNIMCQVVFGTHYEYDDEFITTIVQSTTEITKICNGPWAMLYSSLPFIRKLPLPFNKAFKAVKRRPEPPGNTPAQHPPRAPGDGRDALRPSRDPGDSARSRWPPGHRKRQGNHGRPTTPHKAATPMKRTRQATQPDRVPDPDDRRAATHDIFSRRWRPGGRPNQAPDRAEPPTMPPTEAATPQDATSPPRPPAPEATRRPPKPSAARGTRPTTSSHRGQHLED
ncbi:cytochrome P450 2F2-like, partial [Acanthochromis polyacanthus]|uniref:cytochrome P450 2F2-like n=1 Tax=Acanthochromis polyacanthus TaxID=80966 RepID=UPI0022343BDD